MRRMDPTLVVEALDPLERRRTLIRWVGHEFSVSGDNHVDHGGESTGPDGFDLLAAALGQCLLNTLLAKAQRDGIAIRAAQAVVSTKARLRGRGRAPFLSDFKVDLYLDATIDDESRAELERWAQAMCGVRETLLQSPRIEEHVHLGPAPSY
jgi:uncharacterized OsmC-like protein